MRMCELRLEGGDRAFHAERVDRAEVKVQSHSACSRDGRAAGVQRAEGASGQGGGHAAGGRRTAGRQWGSGLPPGFCWLLLRMGWETLGAFEVDERHVLLVLNTSH